jgi:hypothetical protein
MKNRERRNRYEYNEKPGKDGCKKPELQEKPHHRYVPVFLHEAVEGEGASGKRN